MINEDQNIKLIRELKREIENLKQQLAAQSPLELPPFIRAPVLIDQIRDLSEELETPPHLSFHRSDSFDLSPLVISDDDLQTQLRIAEKLIAELDCKESDWNEGGGASSTSDSDYYLQNLQSTRFVSPTSNDGSDSTPSKSSASGDVFQLTVRGNLPPTSTPRSNPQPNVVAESIGLPMDKIQPPTIADPHSLLSPPRLQILARQWKNYRYQSLMDKFLEYTPDLKEANVIAREMKKLVEFQFHLKSPPHSTLNTFSFWDSSTGQLQDEENGEDMVVEEKNCVVLLVKVKDYKYNLEYFWTLKKLRRRVEVMRVLFGVVGGGFFSSPLHGDAKFGFFASSSPATHPSFCDPFHPCHPSQRPRRFLFSHLGATDHWMPRSAGDSHVDTLPSSVTVPVSVVELPVLRGHTLAGILSVGIQWHSTTFLHLSILHLATLPVESKTRLLQVHVQFSHASRIYCTYPSHSTTSPLVFSFNHVLEVEGVDERDFHGFQFQVFGCTFTDEAPPPIHAPLSGNGRVIFLHLFS